MFPKVLILNLLQSERLKHQKGARLRQKSPVFAQVAVLNVNLLFNIKHIID